MNRKVRATWSMIMAFLVFLSAIQFNPALMSKASAAVSGAYGGEYSKYGVIDLIDLGNEASEQAHKLVASDSQAVIGAEGETARVSLPKSTPDYFGGDITFTIDVDPDAQNYFTLKLWGSDAAEYRAFLAIDNQVIYPAPLVIAKMAEEAPIENRFYYSTIPIPIEKTKGKSELKVTIRTASTYYPYSAGTFSLAYQEKVVTPSNKYYTGYVHTTAALAQEVIKNSGKLTSYIPPVRSNGANGSDLDPTSVSASNMQKKLFNDVKTILTGILARDASTANFTTANWNHSDHAHGNGMMLLPYSQNDQNLYNLKYFSEAMQDNDVANYDNMLQEFGIDNLLHAMLGAMDRNIINYLNRPGTIQMGGHQSSWGGFYQGLGEALWNVSELFESGRYESLGGKKYMSFEAWYNGDEKINWKEKFSTVANFYHAPEAGKNYPFLLDKAAGDVGEEPYITTRRAAYEEVLWLNFNYARTHAYTLTPLTNQVMFQMFGAWRSNAGLLVIGSGLAENYKSSLRQLYRSTGVLPYYDIDVVAGSIDAAVTPAGAYTGELTIKNIEAFNSATQYDADRNYIGEYRKAWGEEYYMVTDFGLTRETTYVAGYGEHSDFLVHGWRLVKDAAERYENTAGIKLADESELLTKSLLASNARAHMKYADTDTSGYRALRLEATIEARGPFYPYDAGYHVKMNSSGTGTVNPFIFAYLKAEMDKDTEKYEAYFGADYDKFYGYATDAVGYAQQMLEDNQLTPFISKSFASDMKSLAGYNYVINHARVAKLLPSTNLEWYSAAELQGLREAGFDEDSFYSSSFFDIENSIVYFRDEDAVYMLAFEYKSDSGLNGVSRIHAVSSDYDRIAMLDTEVQYTPSGFWNFGTGWTTVSYNIVFDPVTGMPDGSTNITEGEIFPVASWKGYDDQIALTAIKSGSPYGGYGEFYSVQYAQYIIAMNTTRESYSNAKNYEIVLPSAYKKSTIYDKMSNSWMTVRNGKVTVPAFTAVALDLESDQIINDVPNAPIFAAATSTNGKVALTWAHSAGTNGSYEILRSTAKDSGYKAIHVVDNTTNLYVDATVVNGETYYYKVRGKNTNGLAGNVSPYAKVSVSANALIENWSYDTTVWSLNKQIRTIEDLSVAMSEGTITFTGNTDKDGNLLFAYTNNVLASTAADNLSAASGDFEFVAEIKSGEDIGIMFKESLDVKSRGGYLTIDGDGNYEFVYRQQPNLVRVDDMRVDGYHIYNNLNPVPVTGHIEDAKWLKVSRVGLYVYAYASVDGENWQPIGNIGYPLYPELSPDGESYFMDNNWHLMKNAGEFYLPMADTLYVGVASSGAGQAANIALTSLNIDTSLPDQVKPTIKSDSVNGEIRLDWKHVLKASYYNVYKTQDAAAAEQNPTTAAGWELAAEKVKDIVFVDSNYKAGSNGPVYYKVVAFNDSDQPGVPSAKLTGEISLDSIEYPASAWKTVDVFTPTAGNDLMSGSTLNMFSDGLRYWNTSGNSFRFVYQEIPAKSEGTFIARVDKSTSIGEHIGEALMVKNNVKAAYDGASYHRSVRINDTKGIFALAQQSSWSSRFATDNTGDNQDAWLRLDTHQGSENIDVYYAPALKDAQAYPADDEWVHILTFDKTNDLTSPNWRDLDNGTDGKWFVGLGFATGGLKNGTNFYNVAPIFNTPDVTLNGALAESTKKLTVQTGTAVSIKLSAKDAFGVNTLPAGDIELVGALPAGAAYDAATAELTWSPALEGTFTIPFKVQDKSSINDFYGGMDVTITVMNDTVIPVIDEIGDKTYYAETVIDLNLSAEIKDVATFAAASQESIAYSISSIVDNKGNSYSKADLNLTFSSEGKLQWTPTKLQTGVYTIAFTAATASKSTTKFVRFTIIGAPLFELPSAYAAAAQSGQPIEIMAESKLLLPLKISDPTGRAYYSYTDDIPAGALYGGGSFEWTPTYAQSLTAEPIYTLKIVSYNARFKNEIELKFKVLTPDDSAPVFTQQWKASAFSDASLANLKYVYSGLANNEVSLNNNSHSISGNYNQGTGRSSFVYQPLTGDAEIVARIVRYDGSGEAPSKFAGILISDHFEPEAASIGINKSADMVFMALSAGEYKGTQAGRWVAPDNSVLAFARNNNPTNGDFPNLGYGTGQTDWTKTYWVKMTYTINGDGSATVQGYYRVDGIEEWTTDNSWKFNYSKAQVDKGLYGGLMASPGNREVKFDNAQVIMNAVQINANLNALTSIHVKAEHAYEDVAYRYNLTVGESTYSDAAISTNGIFNWIPTHSGTYQLKVTATAQPSGEEAVKNFVIKIVQADKTALEALVSSVQHFFKDEYTTGSWTSFEASLKAAKMILLKSGASQAEIDGAQLTLNIAKNNLVNARQASAEKDAWIHSSNAAQNNGTTASMTVLRNVDGSQQRLGLVTIDISKFAGKEINSANLKFYNTGNASRSFSFRASLIEYDDWSETGVNYGLFSSHFGISNITGLVDFISEQPTVAVVHNPNEKPSGTVGVWNADVTELIKDKLNNSSDTKLTFLLSVLPETTNEVNPATRESTLGSYSPSLSVNFSITTDELGQFVSTVNDDYSEADYTIASWINMAAAIEAAQGLLVEPSPQQSEINAAYEALKQALVGLVDFKELRALINEAERKLESDYTEDSWNAFPQALQAAKELIATSAPSTAAINSAYTALKSAVDGLVSDQNLRALVAELSQIENEPAGRYTELSWQEAQQALAAAQSILEQGNAGKLEINQALVYLQTAFDSLNSAAELRDFVAALAGLYVRAEFTAASWKTYEDALSLAKALLLDGTAVQSKLDAAQRALSLASHNLVSVKALLEAIMQAKQINDDSSYTRLTWDTFQGRLANAEQLLEDAAAVSNRISKSKINAAISSVIAAQAALLTNVDVTELMDQLRQAGEIAGDGSLYTEISWKALQAAIVAADEILARAVAGDELLMQGAVETAAAALAQALAELVVKPVGPDPTPDPSTPAPAGRSDQLIVQEGDWQKASGGKLILKAGANIKEIVLPANAASLLGSNELQVQTFEGVVITVPYSVLKSLAATTTSTDDVLVISIRQATGAASIAGGKDGFTLVSQVYELSILVRKSNGQESKLSQFADWVTITLPIEKQQVDRELVAIYHFNEVSGKWDYVGGTIDEAGEKIVAKVEHFSKYAVLEYRKAFADVAASHWVARALEVMVANHIVKGTSETNFTPNAKTTRAEFVSMLVRMLRLTEASEVPFKDVKEGTWYASDVAAAFQAGLVTGITVDSFMPSREISREEMAVLALRAYVFASGQGASGDTDISSLQDASQIAVWALEDVKKAVALGLMKGNTQAQFKPKQHATRAEATQLMYNLLQLLK